MVLHASLFVLMQYLLFVIEINEDMKADLFLPDNNYPYLKGDYIESDNDLRFQFSLEK